MQKSHRDYIESLGYKPERFLIFNKHLSNMARKKEGNEMAVIEMEAPEDVEVLGIGHSMVLKKWADENGLTELYESFEGKKLSGVEDVPAKSFNTKVDDFKNNQEVLTDKEIIPAMANESNYDFTRYVHRHDYLVKEMGYEMDPKVNGYTTKNKDRFIHIDMVKNLVVPDDFKKYIIKQSTTPWKYPEEEVAKDAPAPPPVSSSEAKQDIKLDVPKEVENAVASIEPTEKGSLTIEVSTKEIPEINLGQKINDLESLGFPLNKKKDGFVLGPNGGGIQFDSLKVITSDEWPAFLKKYANFYSEFLEEQKSAKKEEKPEPELKPKKTKEEKVPEPSKEVDAVVEVEEEEKESATESKGFKIVDASKIETDNKGHVVKKESEPSIDQDSFFIEGTTNFFSKLLSYRFHTVQLTFVRLDDEKVRLTVKPSSAMEEKAFLDLSPMNLTGTAEDFDNDFFNEIDEPLKATQKLFANSDKYLKELEKAKKKSKMEEDAKKALKDAVEAAEKYAGGKKVTKTTLTKKWEAVTELDPDHKKANEELEKIKQGEIDFK